MPQESGPEYNHVLKRKPLDLTLFSLALVLSLFGLVCMYSASHKPGEPGHLEFFLRQGAALALALLGFLVVRRINWALRPGSWLWFYIPAMLLLALVLLVGHDNKTGATRWISFGIADLQPSELAKLAFVLVLAWFYSQEQQGSGRKLIFALFVLCSMVLIVMGQPDLGTSMVFVFVFFVMTWFTNVPRRWIGGLLVLLALLSVLSYHFLLRDYQKRRIDTFFNPASDPRDAGYHIAQSRIALGSGGLTGKGFLRGTQKQGNFIPVVESDFIFALVGEEFGFLGCTALLLLYFLLLARILALSRTAQTPYERFICCGASAVLFFHVFVNSGMTMGLMPVTGLPLPFVSYGGTALLAFWMLLGICDAVYSNSHRDFAAPRLRR
jgi:rod shape determining protein RodA